MSFHGETSQTNSNSHPVPLLVALKGAAEYTAPRQKVLVVDDDPIVCQVLSLKLRSKGYRVVTACDGPEALNVSREEKPDVVLLDVNFPPDVGHGGGVLWNGFLLAEWLQRSDDTKNIPVILISASDRADYRERASAAGATGFLSKPIGSDQLLDSIERALRSHAGGKTVKPVLGEKSKPLVMALPTSGKAPSEKTEPRPRGTNYFSVGSL